jgi:hypothetical protein
MKDGIRTLSPLCVSLRIPHNDCDEVPEGGIQRGNFCVFRKEVGGNHGALPAHTISGSES